MKRFLILACALLSLPAMAQDQAGWTYGSEGSGDAERVYASIAGEIEGGSPITLTFSSSDLTGRQARFSGLPNPPDCAAGCRVEVSIDGGAAETMRATVPPSEETTLSLRGARDFWRSLAGAQALEISYPDANGKARSAHFAVSGIDLSALPGWE